MTRRLHALRRSFALVALLLLARAAHALIMGGTGNDPVRDPGWPAGAARVFNFPGRVAWWEGPPFGGGEWHAECRGTVDEFNQLLVDFAAIDSPQKRLVIHDGPGRSFWLNPSRQPDPAVDARIDWTFTVWVPENWERLQTLPADFRAANGDKPPVPQLDLYVDRIRFGDLRIPEGIELDDRRLEAHGYSPDDGVVLEGSITSLATDRPLQGRVELQLIEREEQRGYRYTTVKQVPTNAVGKWVIKSTPTGWLRLVAYAPLHVPRVIGHHQIDEQPRWIEQSTKLARGGRVTGRTIDEQGRPLAGVEVSLSGIDAGKNSRYDLLQPLVTVTTEDGRFEIVDVPLGAATVNVRKEGYVRPGLGLNVEIPSSNHELQLTPAASIAIKVDFGEHPPPAGYIVHLRPEGGEVVGSWGGSGQIDVDRSLHWSGIPPGRYVLTGRPNPGNDRQETAPVTVELTAGKQTEVVLKAKPPE